LADDPGRYAWCSYRYYLNPAGSPDWLDWRTVLAEIGRKESAARVAYKRFLDAGMDSPPPNPLDEAVDGWILGSESFVAKMKERADDHQGDSSPSTTITREILIAEVAGAFDVTPDQIRARGRQENQAREAAAWLLREFLGESSTAMGAYLGNVGKSTVSETIRRARERLANDIQFKDTLDEIERSLQRGQVVQSSIFARSPHPSTTPATAKIEL
jgi:hypothetical protein